MLKYEKSYTSSSKFWSIKEMDTQISTISVLVQSLSFKLNFFAKLLNLKNV